MMFLQFFVWGSWAVTMGTYLGKLGFKGGDIGQSYSTAAWAAIISPFFVGMIADRFFSTEKILAVLHLLGGVLMFFVSQTTGVWPFFWVLLAYMLCYMPTLALINSISFHNMDDPAKQFPSIRVLGTIGWIAAGGLISLLDWLGKSKGIAVLEGIEATSIPMKMAAVASILLGLFCFTLPHTPPQSKGKKVTVRDVLGLDALSLLKHPPFLIFTVCSMLICIPLAFYYNFTNMFFNAGEWGYVALKMTLGQCSEILFMLVMPLFFARLGVKKMLLIGMLCWAVRYVLFAFGNMENLVFMFYGGILLHGICYDFFFVTGQIYVDQKAPLSIRASAQGLLAFATLGLGMLAGHYLSGWVVEYYQGADGGYLWKNIWIVPAAMAAVVMVLFAVLFWEKNDAEAIAPEEANDAAAE